MAFGDHARLPIDLKITTFRKQFAPGPAPLSRQRIRGHSVQPLSQLLVLSPFANIREIGTRLVSVAERNDKLALNVDQLRSTE